MTKYRYKIDSPFGRKGDLVCTGSDGFHNTSLGLVSFYPNSYPELFEAIPEPEKPKGCACYECGKSMESPEATRFLCRDCNSKPYEYGATWTEVTVRIRELPVTGPSYNFLYNVDGSDYWIEACIGHWLTQDIGLTGSLLEKKKLMEYFQKIMPQTIINIEYV